MKTIKYYLDSNMEKTIPYSLENEEIAKVEAYNGEYTIEDDGEPIPEYEPTAEEMFNALLGVTE